VEAVLDAAGITTLRSTTVNDPEDAARESAAIGFPVALKASGPGIVHKSDVAGVVLDLASAADVRSAYSAMALRIGSQMTGAVVQAMAEPGVETIVGVVHDPSFGPLVMFGLGGVATELLHDQVFRILPVTDVDAADAVRSLKSSPLLFGYRGAEPVAVDQLEDVLQRVGRLAGLTPLIAELDLNPVIVGSSSVQVADARIRIASSSRPGASVTGHPTT
jgi:acyl-CoA synthetase (NDP forming)